MRFIKLWNDGKVFLNVDESWLNQTTFIRKLWVPTDG